MLKITTTFILFLIGVLTQAQVSENRTITDFSKIEVKNGISISYSNDLIRSAKVECGNNEALKNIVMEVKNGTLKIYTADNNPVKDVTIFIHGNAVNAFSASSKASITLPQTLETRSMEITLSTGAKFLGMVKARANTVLKVSDDAFFNGRVETGKLSGDFSDNAKVVLSGNVYEAFIFTSKNAMLTARNLDTENTVVFASGQSMVNMHAGTNLTLNISDTSKVTYSGTPENVNYSEGALATIIDKSKKGLSAN
jgi:putative autotransporter adhesin-like protein